MPGLTPVCTSCRVNVEEEPVRVRDTCCAGGEFIEVEWCHDTVCDDTTSGPVAAESIVERDCSGFALW